MKRPAILPEAISLSIFACKMSMFSFADFRFVLTGGSSFPVNGILKPVVKPSTKNVVIVGSYPARKALKMFGLMGVVILKLF